MTIFVPDVSGDEVVTAAEWDQMVLALNTRALNQEVVSASRDIIRVDAAALEELLLKTFWIKSYRFSLDNCTNVRLQYILARRWGSHPGSGSCI